MKLERQAGVISMDDLESKELQLYPVDSRESLMVIHR